LKVRFQPQAISEFQSAALYYSGQKPGLDPRFIECLAGESLGTDMREHVSF
jgi:hypothetical protein